MNSINKLVNCFKYIIVGLFIVAMIFLGSYKFPSQNVTVKIEFDNSEIIEKIFTAEEIKNFYDEEEYKYEDAIKQIVFQSYMNSNIVQIEFYRNIKSICVGKIISADLWEYALVNGNQIILNEKACSLIRKTSNSYLMERIIFFEWIFIVFLCLWIGLNALREKQDKNNRDNHGPVYELRRFLKEILKYKEYIVFAARADLKAEVANSYLNRLWWLLEPFFNMLVYVIVFGGVMGRSIENYATFVFSALLMWNYFNHIINYSVKCIRNNRDIVTKIYMPKYVLLLTNMVLNFIKLLFSLLVLIVMLLIFKVKVGMAVFWVLPSYMVMIELSFGFGMIFMHYGVFVDDLAYAIGILLNMLMFLSGIFYDVISTLPMPLNLVMLGINPIAMLIDTMRNALLYNVVSNVPLIGIWAILSILITYIGLHLIYKNENGYVKVI